MGQYHARLELMPRLRHYRAALRIEDAMDKLLQIEDFKPHVGKVFSFKGTRFAFPLDHIVGENQPMVAGMQRKPFILIFCGPKEREYLPPAVYECEVEGGPTYSMYVNPIHTPQPDRQEYQAVFN
jgi:hypothetical protein